MDQVKDVLLPWYKLYMFLVHNAKKLHSEGLAAFSPIDQASPLMSSNVLDRWLHSVTNRLVSFVRQEMDCGRLYTVVPYFAKYIEIFAQIYVHFNYFRLVGHSGRKDHIISLSIIYHALVTTCLVMAPITSIPAEVLYQNLRKVSNKSEESISFCNFPSTTGERDERVEQSVDKMMTVIGLGRSIRERHNIALQTPLKEMLVVHLNTEFLEDITGRLKLVCLYG